MATADFFSTQTWVVPVGVTSLGLTLRGAKGLSVTLNGRTNTGGAGGVLTGTVAVTPGETLTVQIGGGGAYGGGAYAALYRGGTLLAIAGGGGGAGTPGSGETINNGPTYGSGGVGGSGGAGVQGDGGYYNADNPIPLGGTAGSGSTSGSGGLNGGAGTYVVPGDGSGYGSGGGGGGGGYGAGGGGGQGGHGTSAEYGGGGGGGGGSSWSSGSVSSAATSHGSWTNTYAQATFTYNPPPTLPGVFTSPTAGANVDGVTSIAWGASSDPDGGTPLYDVYLSLDGGGSWTLIRNHQAGASFSYDFSAAPATTTALLHVYAFEPDGASAGPRASGLFTVQHNVAPLAPTLVAPPNASSRDLAAGWPFDWTVNDPNTGDPQASYAFRRKLVGAGAYEFYNAATGAWQSTEVFNPSAASDLTFPAGRWTNGASYNWSVRTRDNLGETGPYATDFTVTAGQAPTVVVSGPTTPVTDTTQPVVTWTYSDPENQPQQSYRVRVFTAAQVAAGGFDPGTSTSLLDSTETTSAAARSWAVPSPLSDGGSYRAYVRATQAGVQSSAWAYRAFTVDLTPPSPPSLVATDEPSLGRVRLDLTAVDEAPTFTPANTTGSIECSSDNGQTWQPVRGATALTFASDRTVTVYDYEAPPGSARLYRARTAATL